jgi:hypothetical protein
MLRSFIFKLIEPTGNYNATVTVVETLLQCPQTAIMVSFLSVTGFPGYPQGPLSPRQGFLYHLLAYERLLSYSIL